MNLGPAAGAVIARGRGIGIILNDDSAAAQGVPVGQRRIRPRGQQRPDAVLVHRHALRRQFQDGDGELRHRERHAQAGSDFVTAAGSSSFAPSSGRGR